MRYLCIIAGIFSSSLGTYNWIHGIGSPILHVFSISTGLIAIGLGVFKKETE